MVNTYPKTFPIKSPPQSSPKMPPMPGVPANDNWRPPPQAANDNFKQGVGLLKYLGRRTKWGDARAQLIASGVSLTLDLLFPEAEYLPKPQQSEIPEGFDMTGWTKVYHWNDPHYNVPGADTYGWEWPNFTDTDSNGYNYALAGYYGKWYVWPFFTKSIPVPKTIMSWKFFELTDWWRVSSGERWSWSGETGEQAWPVWREAVSPQPAWFIKPDVFPRSNSWRNAGRAVSWDVWGNQIRGYNTSTTLSTRQSPGFGYMPKPPGPGVKETKVKYNGLVGFLFNAFEQATELVDLAWNIYDALPESLRKKLKLKKGWKDLPAALDALYKYWDQVDVSKALANIIMNHYSDKAWNEFFKRVAKARKDLGIVTGPSFHPPSIWG